uniref:Uncharacterized protein n=1 Tax=Chelydra serpentina TaxID=8475 RepID=A0A8C3S3D0_CHESE
MVLVSIQELLGSDGLWESRQPPLDARGTSLKGNTRAEGGLSGYCRSGVRGTPVLWRGPRGLRVRSEGHCGEIPGGCGSGVRGTTVLWGVPGGCRSGVRCTVRPDASLPQVLEELPPLEVPLQRVVVPAFPTTPSPSPQPVGEPSPSGSEELPPCTALEDGGPGEPRFSLGFTSGPCRSRSSGHKNARRKRDLVLSKLVHNVHNHITNQRRFNGSESIKSSWNIGVVKFLLEKLRHELVTSQHNYTDKELKGERVFTPCPPPCPLARFQPDL